MPPFLHSPPAELCAAPFLAMDAFERGVTPGALRGTQYRRLHRGVYEVADPASRPILNPEAVLIELARGYAPLLRPHEAFSHTTALVLAGAPIRTPAELHVSIPLPANRADCAGVFGHRTVYRFESKTSQTGFVIVPLEMALLQSANKLPFRELLVALDYFLLMPEYGTRPDALQLDRGDLDYLLKRSRARGVRRLRAALSLARNGAESRMETITRLELVRLGIDIFDLQAVLFARNGERIGRFDFVNRELRLIIEFDGDQHRTDRQQYLKDLTRLEKVEAAGYRVLRLHSEDFWSKNIERTQGRLLEFVGQHMQLPVPSELRRLLAESY